MKKKINWITITSTFIFFGFFFLVISIFAYLEGENETSNMCILTGVILLGFGFIIKSIKELK